MGGVQSVDRALQIIETLAEDDEGYRLSGPLAVRPLSTSTRTGCWDAGEAPLRAVRSHRIEVAHPARQSFFGGGDLRPPPQFCGAGDALFAQAARPDPRNANLAVVDDESISC